MGEADRKMLKAAIKHSAGADQVRHRTVPPEIVAKYVKKLDSLKPEITGVMQDEKEEKHVRILSLNRSSCVRIGELTPHDRPLCSIAAESGDGASKRPEYDQPRG